MPGFLLPYYHMSIRTPLRVRSLVQLLYQRVETDALLLQWPPPCYPHNVLGYRGTITYRGFEINRFNMRFPWSMRKATYAIVTIYGKFYPEHDGTRIEVRILPNIGSLIIMAALTVFWAIVVSSIAMAKGHHHPWTGSDVVTVVALTIFVAHLWLTPILSFRGEVEEGKRFLGLVFEQPENS